MYVRPSPLMNMKHKRADPAWINKAPYIKRHSLSPVIKSHHWSAGVLSLCLPLLTRHRASTEHSLTFRVRAGMLS